MLEEEHRKLIEEENVRQCWELWKQFEYVITIKSLYIDSGSSGNVVAICGLNDLNSF